jgi:hypothetical protein
VAIVTFKTAVIQYLQEALPPLPGSNVPFRVVNAYPTKPELLPCVSVNQVGGSLETQSIGQEWAGVQQRADGQYVETTGALYREAVEVMLWATNPKTRDVYAMIIRKALWKAMRYFEQAYGVTLIRISEQGDGQDLEARAPTDTFSFAFEFSGLVGITDEIPVPTIEDLTFDAVLSAGSNPAEVPV